MNDPDETSILPAFEVNGGRDAPPAAALPTVKAMPPVNGLRPVDTIYPRPGATANDAVLAGTDPVRFEPTVFGAVRRHAILVIATGIVLMIAAIGYSLLQGKIYQTQANVTVPLPVSSTATAADPGQYLDSQVVLLQSKAVAEQAATIANQQLGSGRLDAADFSTSKGGSLSVTPPTTTNAGTYGASIVSVAFSGPSADVSRVGLQAILQAFHNAISSNITAEANATIAGIDRAIAGSTSPDQQSALATQRTQVLINEQTDLAQTATAAVGSTTRANGHWSRNGAIGLVVGLILGVAIAYGLAVRRRSINGRQDPRVIYNAPMIAETPAIRIMKEWQTDLPADKALLPVAAAPGSPAAEAFRFAANSVNRVSKARGTGSAIALISPRAGVGKTTVVSNLALAMAEGGKTLLVVDAGTTEGGLATRLLPGVQLAGGLEQVLSGKRRLMDCVQPSPLGDGIHVLGYDGPAKPRVTGAARAAATSALLAKAKANFDVVLVDTPALLQVADAFDLVSAADAVLVIVNPNDRLQDHLETMELLKPAGPEVLGFLYNQSSAPANVSRHMADLSAAVSARRTAARNRPRIVRAPQLDSVDHQPSGDPQD